jgi:hypothetical protein
MMRPGEGTNLPVPRWRSVCARHKVFAKNRNNVPAVSTIKSRLRKRAFEFHLRRIRSGFYECPLVPRTQRHKRVYARLRRAMAQPLRSGALQGRGRTEVGVCDDPGSAKQHFVLHRARETQKKRRLPFRQPGPEFTPVF